MCGAVQELRDYCVHVITRSINEHTQLNGLTQRDLQEVCAGLSVDLPLPIALSLPLDNLYWRRRTQAHFPPPHVSLQSGGQAKCRWQAMATGVCRTLPVLCDLCHPGHKVWLEATVCSPAGVWEGCAHLASALLSIPTSIKELTSVSITINTSRGNGEVVEVEPGSLSHLDLFEIISALPNLQELSIRYQSTQEGTELVWGAVGASVLDLAALTPALTPTLTHLKIYESCIDDTRAERLLTGLKGHPNLTCLDLRHNLLTCASAPHLADLLNSCPSLRSLNLHHNNIGSTGGSTLGEALARRPPLPLEALMMDLNPLGSKGGTALLQGAAASSSYNDEMMEGKGAKRRRGLCVLSLAGCGLGDECWDPLVAALTSSLRYVCLAANSFTQEPPKEVLSIVEGRGRGGKQNHKKGDKENQAEREESPRLLLTNLEGSTYLLGSVMGGHSLAPPLLHLREALQSPITPAAAREDLSHHLPLHGVCLREQDFFLEEELRGMCLFSKEARQVLEE
ncbi:dynein regulatory complex subunit 5-like isoform X3 [Portunus trituberculatus]|uniref:dynein regulatory complex subunit 5-like isoform X3 n=1 Tax=Portunus trituberculatus TaxID=210409 RepID=UPI001E1D13AA|nr:dynein regulatory complex subunit 5-like isoform X3 [Portunus trituberculatus]